MIRRYFFLMIAAFALNANADTEIVMQSPDVFAPQAAKTASSLLDANEAPQWIKLSTLCFNSGLCNNPDRVRKECDTHSHVLQNVSTSRVVFQSGCRDWDPARDQWCTPCADTQVFESKVLVLGQ